MVASRAVGPTLKAASSCLRQKYFRCLNDLKRLNSHNPTHSRIKQSTFEMNDPGLNNLLKWGIQNSEASRADSAVADQPPPKVDIEALQRLISGFNGPSDAELMVESMNAIESEKVKLEDKCIAFENFEQLIEGLDNANNMENLGLWTRLVAHLDNAEPDLRMYAAWCCGIAVQNNIKTQERVSSH